MPQSLHSLKRILQTTGLVLGLLACNSEEKPPADLLEEEKMAQILSEVHMAEARVTQMQLRSLDSSVIVFEKLQDQIWKKFKVDTALYRKSYAFYTSHPFYLTRIYERVDTLLAARAKADSTKR
ncbi:DUF4296 domain-containing protein [Arundinibacter roseus]|uniref:DUF4296 domain-containing protein n=1 Tax=Arundinibacter roseus TaxID=2070510 RepID=A0A4R4K9P3_9BACT|nr:DUF4296 domain-containing protein [Arundinibacter roseus]TDB63352.1 DUF4296 domain-containing protein [Arundinibacter roseus]